MPRGSDDILSGQTRLSVGPLAEPAPEQVDQARLAAARAACRRHPDNPGAARGDLRMLLDMLGLASRPGPDDAARQGTNTTPGPDSPAAPPARPPAERPEPHPATVPAGHASDTPDWRQRGACKDGDPDLHQPVSLKGPSRPQIEEAKSVCRRCPVLADCLTWSLETALADTTVAGGMTGPERRKWRAAGSPQPSPTGRPDQGEAVSAA